GNDFTAYVGDPKPTLADFKASATDKDGKAVDVTADLSNVDMQKAGTYDVILTAADGQTKTVKLTVLANQ
ncbi:bacterial Ig-like domain-containing protein, partial [Schleiferilactobacillus harbinensis]